MWSVLFISQPFSRYTKVSKNWKCTEWTQTDLEHLTVKIALYTLNTLTTGPNFSPFCSMTSCFPNTSLSKIRNVPSDLRLALITQLSKVPCIHWIVEPKAQFFLCFGLGPVVFRCKIIENQKCTKWPQTDLENLTVKSSFYTLNTTCKVYISLHSTLWVLLVKIIAVFGLYVEMVNIEISGRNH